MKKDTIFILIIFFFLSTALLVAQGAYAQAPVITTFKPAKAWYGSDVYIQGSGFTTVKEDLVVKFGAVAAKVIESTASVIRVQVPAGATYGTLTVTYKPSGLTAYSPQPFLLSFGGKENETPLFDALVKLPLNTGVKLYDVCTCDLDGDGRNDIVGSNPEGTSITSYLNNSTIALINFPATFPNRKEINAGKNSRFMSCGDLDGDGKADLVLTGSGITQEIIMLKNTSTAGTNGGAGSINFGPFQLLAAPSKSWQKPLIQDLNGDGKPEIILTNETDNQVIVYKNTSTIGSISFDQTYLSFPVSAASNRGLRVKDINNDGLADLTVSNYYGSKVYFLINNSAAGSISFQAATAFSANSGITNHELEDIDGDGKMDLMTLDYFNNKVHVYLNNGTKGILSFAAAKSFTTGSLPVGLELGDLNGDQKPDILVGSNSLAKASVLTNISSPGSLDFTVTELNSPTTGKFANLQISDFDGDAIPDVVIADNGSQNFYLYRNLSCIAPVISESKNGESISLATVQSPPTTSGTPSLTYQWYLDGNPISTDHKIEDILPGNYRVEIGTTNCGTVTSAPFTLNNCAQDMGNPVIEAVPVVCEGQPFSLSVSPAVSGATYTWTNKFSGISETTSTNTLRIAIADPELHSGSYTLSIKGSCSLSLESGEVVIYPKPTAIITADGALSICPGESRILAVEDLYSAYQWKKNGENIVSATSATYTASERGSYTLVVENENGCQAETEALAIEVKGDLQAKFYSPSAACLNEPVQFFNTSTFPADATVHYIWDFGDGNQSTEKSPQHTYSQAGSLPYKVTLSIQFDNSPCNSTYSSSLTVSNTPNITIEALDSTTFCTGDSVKVQIAGDVSSVDWSNGGTGLFTYAKEGGILQAEVTTAAGCVLTKELEFTSLSAPVLDIQADKTTVGRGESAQLQVSGGVSYTWEPAESLDNPGVSNPFASPEKTTTYKVTAVGENGCSAVAEITIEVDTNFKVQTPKLFIPPTDHNWVVSNIENFPDVSLTILNKFGRTVFAASPYENNWNGTEGGNNLTQGVYFYVFKDATGNVIKTGSITLVR